MEKIWLKSYPPGVPENINPDEYQSVVDIFDQSTKKFPNHPAFYNLGTTLTYLQIEEYSIYVASYFKNVLRLKKGDRVAIMLPNLLQYPIVMIGALRLGLIVVNVNPLYTTPELIHQMNDSGAETIVVLSNFAKTVQDALPHTKLKNIIVTDLGDLFPLVKGKMIYFVLKYILHKIPAWKIPHAIKFKKLFSHNIQKKIKSEVTSNQDIAFLQYTGGTTGVSKGAVLTHRNILSNMQQAHAWFGPILTEGEEILITALPLYHIFSLTANCLFFSRMGGLNVLITNPRDVKKMISEMSKFKFTAITGVNTLFNALIKSPLFKKLDFSKLKLTLGGGMAVQHIVADQWQEITKTPLLEAYGLTEASPCVTMNPPYLKTYSASVGLPVSSTDVCFMDDEGHEVPMGHPGELAVKGPQVMQGYWQNPQETAKVFTADEWLLTGDIAVIDEKGFVRILERKKDMILVSGFNVYPNEIEDALVTIPGVIEAAVVGVPDTLSGEAVKAFLVSHDPQLTKEEVIVRARKMLTGYKVPKYVEFRNELPKSNVGKILRKELRVP